MATLGHVTVAVNVQLLHLEGGAGKEVGGVIAWLLVSLSLTILSDPVERLSGLYQSQFELTGLDATTTGMLIATSILLGLAGSWLAVGRHLRDIEPT